ncbi:L-cystine transporter, partial [Geobacillus stearothermophilus]|nr:L-cystine transporter [Geobacillus stearothermophilus]
MNVYLIIFNVAILLLLIGVLAYMQKKHVSFSKRVFTALGLGIAFGFALQAVYGAGSAIVQQSTQWFDIVGTGYV